MMPPSQNPLRPSKAPKAGRRADPGRFSGAVPAVALEADAFDLALSMDCGQVFGWHRDGAVYTGMIGGAAVSLWQEGETVHYASEGEIGEDAVRRYLGLDEDLGKILKAVAKDAFMKRVVAKVRGLRLLKQDPWPCLCSYILSSNNRVDRIDRLVKEIALRFGRSHEVGGRVVHSLPTPGELAGCDEPGLRSCGMGFRAPYLAGAARMVEEGQVDLKAIDEMTYDQARDLLMTIPGVGGKISDCVLLFAFSKYEAFPVDVWIGRAMQKVYLGSRETKPDEVRRFGREYFGRYAGYAQEYIYEYVRKNGAEALFPVSKD
jgi:N-glycosylase/DNA lyase